MGAAVRFRGQRVLCVCQKGNSRSVALAWLLKRDRKADALAVGIQTASAETFEYLCLWAQIIILTDRRLDGAALDAYRAKVVHFDVGTDVWFHGYDTDLIERYRAFIEALP